MFTAITNSLANCATTSQGIARADKVKKLGNFLDFAGGITAVVLGALALTGHGGAMVAHLNDVTGGAWATMGGGLITLYSLHLQNKQKQAQQHPVIQNQDPYAY